MKPKLEKTVEIPLKLVTLDPEFWRCLGKAEGWGKVCNCGNKTFQRFMEEETNNRKCTSCRCLEVNAMNEYLYHWHDFIDHLAEGGTPEDFFKRLLK